MEKSVVLKSLAQEIKEQFGLKERDPMQYAPLTLAYIGDVVYDVVFRMIVISDEVRSVNQYHRIVCSNVSAVAQSKLVGFIEEEFTETELAVYKRGRNAKSFTKAKNASVIDYRRATGLEALIGYLFLQNEYERLCQLIHLGLSRQEEEKKENE